MAPDVSSDTNLGAPRVGVTRGNSGEFGDRRDVFCYFVRYAGGWSTGGEGKNLGAGPFDLEGSGFRANFKHQRNEHAPPSMGLLFDS